MKEIGYYNGKIGPLDEMTVPMNDRAVYFGDGIYEATGVLNKRAFALDDHFDRMYKNLELIMIEPPMDREALRKEINDFLALLEDDDSYQLYWQVSRGTAARNHRFPMGAGSNLMMTVRPKPLYDVTKEMKLITMEDTRFYHCNIKTINLIPAVIASQKAYEAGCDEVVFHRGDVVTECAHSNIHMLKDGKFITHPLDNFILPGITRKHLLKMCEQAGIPIEERIFTLDELMEADELIVTASSVPCARVSEVNGKPIAKRDGATVKLLQDTYLKYYYENTSK